MTCGLSSLRKSGGLEGQPQQHPRCGVIESRAAIHNTFGVDTLHAQWPRVGPRNEGPTLGIEQASAQYTEGVM